MAEVVEQIWVVGTLSQRCIEVRDRLGQLASFDLCDPQRVLCAGPLEMRNGLGGVTLREKCIAQKLVSDQEVGTQIERALEWRDGQTVFMFLHVRGAEIDEGVGEVGVEFGGLAKFCYFDIDLVLLARLKSRLKVLKCIGRRGLRRKPSQQEELNHKFSGSRISRNWLARTSFKTCLVPEGQRISTAAFSAEPSPKCRRLSLAQT